VGSLTSSSECSALLREQLAQLRERLANLDAGEGAPLSFFDWSLGVPEPKSGRLDFERFPFQRELYEHGTEDRDIVVMKSTQVGISAWALRWALYQADVLGRRGLYVFPTQRDVHDFSTARIKPVIDKSDHLRGRRGHADPFNKGLVGVGDGLVYFRGSESRRGLDSVDADYVVFDEYDTLAHKNIPDAERRVTGPLSAGLIRRVGVPTFPGWGIARLYTESDQRRWQVKCGSCGEWQAPEFEANVDQESHVLVHPRSLWAPFRARLRLRPRCSPLARSPRRGDNPALRQAVGEATESRRGAVERQSDLGEPLSGLGVRVNASEGRVHRLRLLSIRGSIAVLRWT